VVALACRKAKELGYPHEVWTTRLLADHARAHGPAEGHSCLSELAQGTVCKILDAQEVKPHKVRYYLERRDPEFKAKMAQVLCVYRKVKVLKKAAAVATKKNGERLKVTYMDRLAPPPKATAAQIRTVSAWGAAKQADLARLRVGLAGAGRVGGFIAEGLARTGFEDVATIDYDKVEEKNLDRLIVRISAPSRLMSWRCTWKIARVASKQFSKSVDV